jgi:hypothetical protein
VIFLFTMTVLAIFVPGQTLAPTWDKADRCLCLRVLIAGLVALCTNVCLMFGWQLGVDLPGPLGGPPLTLPSPGETACWSEVLSWGPYFTLVGRAYILHHYDLAVGCVDPCCRYCEES